jgi:hypothetical protein
MDVLALSFRSLRHLDLGIYIYEWAVPTGIVSATGLLMRSLRRLNESPNIDSLCMRIQCHDGTPQSYYLQRPEEWDEWAKINPDQFLELCRQQINVKQITVDSDTIKSGFKPTCTMRAPPFGDNGYGANADDEDLYN